MKRTIIYLLFSLLFIASGYSQGYHVRIAFVGNSITIGSGLANAPVECYPSRVDQMLKEVYGDTCTVQNFAVSGRTMLKDGDFPIWDEPQFDQMWNFAPDIVYILMGTNDSKPYNWGDTLGGPGDNTQKFFDDYMSMIDTMKMRNPRTKFIISLPPPAFGIVYDIRDSVIKNGVIPVVESIQKLTGADLVDFYHPLLDSAYLFPDKIHPNAAGAKVMAKMVFNKIQEKNLIHQVKTGYTYVTSITSNQRIIKSGDSAKLTWTSINADSVYFEGQKVDINGTVTVSPVETKIYTVYAFGQKSIDSLKFKQPVYFPALTKIGINPRATKITQHDSVKFELSFYDQHNKTLAGQTFNVVWSIREGGGYLIDKTNTSATFVGSDAGKSYLVATVDTVSIEARITVEANVGTQQSGNDFENKFYPNPVNGNINFEFNTTNLNPVEISIFDLKGAILLKEEISILKVGRQKVSLKTDQLKSGIYLFEVDGQDLKYTGKFKQQ
jgi:acyl-CoA thioesterase I